MIYTTNEIKRERAILIAIDLHFTHSGFAVNESLDELEKLTETAGAQVIGRIVQKRDKPHPATFVGTGMVQEIIKQIEVNEADLVIFDDELSGVQMKNLENSLMVPVVDRTMLILDIFAQRAQSREGKLQVELAQLQYQLSRLTGTGRQLSRQGGGIGTRGPGETKLETDRRHIRGRIVDIKSDLEDVRRHRTLQRLGRVDRVPVIVLVGYTNAGKSTLRYELVRRYSSITDKTENNLQGEDKLFATLDPTLRYIDLPGDHRILLGDTVGFIQKIPHQLISAFQATLEEVSEADGILHVVDVSSPHYEKQMEVVEKLLEKLGASHKPQIIVYNKIDQYKGVLPIISSYSHPVAEVSAIAGTGFDTLLDLMVSNFIPQRKHMIIGIPYNESKWLNHLYQEGKVFHIEYKEQYIYIEAEVDHILAHKLQAYELKIEETF